jgi:cell wall assembly regulator SMI1
MHPDWILQLQALINTREDISMGVPVRNKEIQEAEAELEIDFPLSVKSYLKNFGYLVIAHKELYGLGPDIPDHLSIVKETLAERKIFRPYIPVHLLPMQNDGGGNHYCLDLSSSHENPPIVFWSHEDDENQIPDKVSESFTSWLLEVVDETFEA